MWPFKKKPIRRRGYIERKVIKDKTYNYTALYLVEEIARYDTKSQIKVIDISGYPFGGYYSEEWEAIANLLPVIIDTDKIKWLEHKLQ